MVIEHDKLDWSMDLFDSLWFHIGNYLTVNDIDRLSRTCLRLHNIFTTNDFWSHLIRMKFGQAIWSRFIRNGTDEYTDLFLSNDRICRSKSIYLELMKRHCSSLADFDTLILDTNRNYLTVPDSTSLNGHILHINDSIEFCYSIYIETNFKDVLPGRYDVLVRMKLDLPYLLGDTEFIAVADQANPSEIAYTKWTQDDFLSMYRCFNCDVTKENLWFYHNIGMIEIHGNQRCNVHVSVINQDPIHAKTGVYLDYVELKLRSE